jgi:predicted nucleotidyltransferase component of viral defense system
MALNQKHDYGLFFMNPLNRRDVLDHQGRVPWPTLAQVEQDLQLCRAIDAIFSDKFLASQVAMRGGTLLHKVHLAPAARYSEDIDLVAIGDRPEGHIKRSLRRVLKDVLGSPQHSTWEAWKLAVRNAAKKSRLLRMIYALPSVGAPGRQLEIQIETNMTERVPCRPIQRLPFAFSFRGARIDTLINAYDVNEMLGTKMRALFQRQKGRDLFDLYWALTHAKPPVSPADIIDSFQHYMNQEGTIARRGAFTEALRGQLENRGFCRDMEQLLRADLQYDPREAGQLVQKSLLDLLPEEG